MSNLSFEEKIRICMENDGSFDGQFFLAVKSTQIFCLPSCKAKFPKKINIEFFNSKSEAMNNGYRGCKRCRSEYYPNTEPEWVKLVEGEIDKMITKKLDNVSLEKIANVNLSTIKKYFKKYRGLTPAQYHRNRKLEIARNKILQGADYRDVCFELGFESISGFRDAYKKRYNQNPGEVL